MHFNEMALLPGNVASPLECIALHFNQICCNLKTGRKGVGTGNHGLCKMFTDDITRWHLQTWLLLLLNKTDR